MNYLNGLKIQQTHTFTDVKLALGYTAVIISAATFAADYKLGWDATKVYTAFAVVAYFLLNGAFTYWMYFVEKDVIFTGDWKGRKVRSQPIFRQWVSRGREHALIVVRSSYQQSRKRWTLYIG